VSLPISRSTTNRRGCWRSSCVLRHTLRYNSHPQHKGSYSRTFLCRVTPHRFFTLFPLHPTISTLGTRIIVREKSRHFNFFLNYNYPSSFHSFFSFFLFAFRIFFNTFNIYLQSCWGNMKGFGVVVASAAVASLCDGITSPYPIVFFISS
jgi:hypothetical protein